MPECKALTSLGQPLYRPLSLGRWVPLILPGVLGPSLSIGHGEKWLEAECAGHQQVKSRVCPMGRQPSSVSPTAPSPYSIPPCLSVTFPMFQNQASGIVLSPQPAAWNLQRWIIDLNEKYLRISSVFSFWNCDGTRLECWRKNQVALGDLGGLEIYFTPAGSEENISPKI